jgi:hypothetical protein
MVRLQSFLKRINTKFSAEAGYLFSDKLWPYSYVQRHTVQGITCSCLCH